MAKAETSPILQLIRRVASDQRARRLTDHDLLQRFGSQRDVVAFHALLLRHGPMVLEVCRGVLINEADAEDAFQATFLILASKAGSIRKAASVGSWLHGVAYRTALKARAKLATRKKHEAGAPARPFSEPDDITWRDVQRVLHEELTGLAERHRGPLVACYLEGRTQDEAAAHLGLGKTTLKERLEYARSLLRTRLVRRGLGPAAVLVTAGWPSASASACLPATLVSTTTKAAGAFAARQAAAPGVISVKVAALTEGATGTMLATKLKFVTVMLLVIASGALSVWIHQTARQPAKAEIERVLTPVAHADQLDLRNARTGAKDQQPAVPEGRWLLAVVENELHNNSSFAIIETEQVAGGRVKVKVASTVLRDDLKIRSATIEGSFLKIVFETSRGDWPLEAALPAKDEKKMLGSLNINSQILPVTLTRTDKTELKREDGVAMLRKSDDIPQALEIHQLYHKTRELRGQVSTQKSDDKTSESRKKAEQAEKDAAEKAPKLFDELLEKNADDPVVLYTALNVLKILGKAPYDQPKVQRVVEGADKAARSYGPAMNKELKIRIATVLSEIDGAARYALEFVNGLEKDLSGKDDTNTLVRILNPLMIALKKAGKTDEANAVAARIKKLDEILDSQYLAKVPPFKPEKYQGRSTKSRRVVVRSPQKISTQSVPEPSVRAGRVHPAPRPVPGVLRGDHRVVSTLRQREVVFEARHA